MSRKAYTARRWEVEGKRVVKMSRKAGCVMAASLERREGKRIQDGVAYSGVGGSCVDGSGLRPPRPLNHTSRTPLQRTDCGYCGLLGYYVNGCGLTGRSWEYPIY